MPGRRVLPPAPADLAARGRERSWPSARLPAQVLAPLPAGTFSGVDDHEVYAFLAAHAPAVDGPAAGEAAARG